jgi:hypothetical protein
MGKTKEHFMNKLKAASSVYLRQNKNDFSIEMLFSSSKKAKELTGLPYIRDFTNFRGKFTDFKDQEFKDGITNHPGFKMRKPYKPRRPQPKRLVNEGCSDCDNGS